MQCFTIMASEIEGRLDPLFYANNALNIASLSNFKSVRLGDYLEYAKSGFAAGKTEQASEDENNPILQIRPTNISEQGELYFDKNIFISRDSLKKRNGDLISKGEVLFNNTNSQEWVGKTALFDEEGAYFSSNHITRLKPNRSLLPEYLSIVLNTYQRNKVFYNICTNWNNQSGVNTNLLKELKIPLPNLHVQQNIVDSFNSTKHLSKSKEAEAEALLASVDDYVLSELGITLPEVQPKTCFTIMASEVEGNRMDAFYHQPHFAAFTHACEQSNYHLTTLGDLSPLMNGYDYRQFSEEGAIYLRVSNIKRNSIDTSDAKYIAPDQAITKDIGLQKGDLLITRKGTYGVAAPVGNEHVGMVISSEVIKSRPVGADAHYLSALLNSPFGRIYFEREKTGAIMGHISQDRLAACPIPLPPLATQQRIAAEVQQRMERAQTLKREAAEELEAAKQQVEAIILGKAA